MAIQQGARSKIRIVQVNGLHSVEKRYNYRKDLPIQKLSKERAFYEHYKGLDIIPELISIQEPDTIVLTYITGERLIDLINAESDSLNINEISRHYGEKLSTFYRWPSSQRQSAKQECRSSIDSIIHNVHIAIASDKRYQLAEIMQSADRLSQLLHVEGWWSIPMMCKYDWSATNMLIQGNLVTCIYDFDTAYMGSRLTFLGNILNSCLHLHWLSVRRGLTTQDLVLPPIPLLEIAGHFSMWQKTLSSFVGGKIRWPDPHELRLKLIDLSTKANLP